MPRLTSADVARESGVSRTTVSYVLNGKEGVAIPEATRQRVRDAAARLGYTPSAAARTLRSGRSDLVLCVLPDWTIGPVIDTLLDHLTTELADRGLSVLVHHDRGPRPLAELWRAVTPRAVLGLAPFAPDDERAMRQAGIQVVGSTLDEDPEHPGTFSVPQTPHRPPAGRAPGRPRPPRPGVRGTERRPARGVRGPPARRRPAGVRTAGSARPAGAGGRARRRLGCRGRAGLAQPGRTR